MDLRSRFGLITGKAASAVLRRLGSGGAALPGLVAQTIAPNLLSRLAKQYTEGIVLVCGTNGKTTTCRLLASALQTAGKQTAHNRSGSNLSRGHLSALLDRASWQGRSQAEIAILEVDEAVLPALLGQVQPRLVLLHNLFRDQLDRYGEVNSIAKKWLSALKKDLPPTSLLLINADDPHLAHLAKELHHPHTIYYGLADPSAGTTTPTSAVDAHLSPASGKPLSYSIYYLSHLGEYQEEGFKRPTLDWKAGCIRLHPVQGSSFQLTGPDSSLSLQLTLPGLSNVYNALAAASAASLLGVEPPVIAESFAAAPSAFGRFERLKVDGKELILCLIKNPAGATEVLRTIQLDKEDFQMLFLMNDHFADGQDVSWYWDVPYELIAPSFKSVICAGERALDLALRLKYAGFKRGAEILSTPDEALRLVLSQAERGRSYFLCTYTAALALQHSLTKHKIKSPYWQE